MAATHRTVLLLSVGLALFLVVPCSTAEAADAETFGVSLLATDTLTGWDHGETWPRGWQVTDGRLTGTAGASDLLSGWTWDDFELRFHWAVDNRGAWRLLLPTVAGDDALRIDFREGEGSGRITSGDDQRAAGISLKRLDNGSHTAIVRKSGDKLTVTLDDEPAAEVNVDRHVRFGLGLALAAGRGSLWHPRMEEPLGEAIFNGRDLTGWWTPGNLDSWLVENGELVCINRGGNYLRSDKLYANFTLSLEYKMRRRGNSGIGIRTARNGWPSGDGMELQLLDRPNTEQPNRSSTMALYGNLEPIALADRSQEWNRVVIKTHGYMVTVWVNGDLVQHANTSRLPELRHRHLQGWIGFQDHGARIQFRDIRVLETPDGRGLKQWYAERSEPASRQTLDRLMNPERLTTAHAIESGVAATQVTSAGRRVLAELIGPGAVVRCWWPGETGRLSFFFDGEQQPRIECGVGELHGLVPPAAVDRRPLLTYLGYQQSLKIVLTDGTPGRYRFDYVSFALGTPVETFADREASIARGMLPAMSYRSHQISHGTHREADPLPRQRSSPKTLEPGSATRLISLDGAGVVRWLKLRVSPQLLTNDDLWLEVTLDGQTSPAIAAPARYLFPGLQGGGNYHNFVMLDRGGPTNLLAMPYGEGLTISARNRGHQTIRDVAVTVSFEPAGEDHRDRFDGRLRLRGDFTRGDSSASTDIFSVAGAGRWVGLVLAHPNGATTGIGSLTIDGRRRVGWAADNMDSFLGVPSAESDARRSLSGRRNGLAWRYLLLAPVEFRSNIRLKARDGDPVGDRLALFYVKKQ